MHVSTQSGIMMTIRNGRIRCPICNKGIAKITQDTEAHNLPLWCRNCEREYIVDISRQRPERTTPEPTETA